MRVLETKGLTFALGRDLMVYVNHRQLGGCFGHREGRAKVMDRIVSILFSCLVLSLGGCGTKPVVDKPSKEGKEAKTAAERLLVWSEPVNGLRARIEMAHPELPELYHCFAILVRVQNIGPRPLAVPDGNPYDIKNVSAYKLLAREKGNWRPVLMDRVKLPNYVYYPDPYYFEDLMPAPGKERSYIVLAPGESALIFIRWHQIPLSEIKVVIGISAANRADGWTGTLETPVRPVRVDPAAVKALKETLDFPRHFPAFTAVEYTGGNMEHGLPAFPLLQISNSMLLEQLELYKPADVAAEMERRMNDEKNIPLALLYASQAAKRGSEAAKTFILNKCKRTVKDEIAVDDTASLRDADIATNAFYALGAVECGERTPEWAIDAWIEALNENIKAERSYRDLVSDGWDESNAIFYFPQRDYSLALAGTKSARALTALIKIAKDPQKSARWMAIDALGETGDERAIEALMDLAQSCVKDAQNSGGKSLRSDLFRYSLHALAELNAKAAVPLLMENIKDRDIVRGLARIGDRRAVPALRKIVADDTFEDKWCTMAARVALAGLEEGDPVPRYAAIFADKSSDDAMRSEAIWPMAQLGDTRVVPILIKAAKTDPSGRVAHGAIYWLSAFKTREAVTGLIECFDVDFNGKGLPKIGGTPDMFRNQIARSLWKITGQSFGLDKDAWEKWWETQGSKDPAFK
jgi:HEAT repeat protein